MARMARDDDGRTARAQARRGDRPDRLCRVDASPGLGGDRPFRRSAGAARQILADRHHRDDLAGLGLDAVAGDRIGDAGVLRARRSRPDHVVAGQAGQRVFDPDRRDRAVGHCDGAAALDAVRRCSRDRRRHPMACGLRRRHRHRPVGRGDCDRGHDRAVSPDRPGANPAGRADPRRDHRRRLRHRAADRRDPVLRHAVAVCDADVGRRRGHRARHGQHRVVAGARGARRWRSAAAAVVRWPRAARRRDGDLLASICRHRRQRFGPCRFRPEGSRAQGDFVAARGNRRCGARNSCCCGAIPG